MKLYCKDCGRQCSNEIPEEKKEEWVSDWNDCPLCMDCVIIRMKDKIT